MRPGQAESTEAYDRPWKRVSTAALSLGAEEEQPTARVPGAGGCKGLILLRPLNAGRRLFPRKATCGWFWYFCHQKYRESRDDVAGVLYLFSAKRYPKTPRQMPPPTSSRLTLAPGDYSRGRTCPVPFARAFSRAFVSRPRHRAGIVRGNSVFSAGKRSEHANMRTGANISCSRVRGESRHHPGKRF